MRKDYKLQGPTQKIQIEVERDVIETIEKMTTHTQLSFSEISNTALRRFIVGHKDFLPPKQKNKT